MLKNLMAVGVLTAFLPFLAQAQTSQFGLGGLIGDPTGISGEFNIDDYQSVDFAVAWSSSDTHIHGDYLLHKPNIGHAGRLPFNLYYGIGARIVSISKGKHEDKLGFGPRAPIGVDLMMEEHPIKFFAEAAVILELTPETEADADIGIGVRYYF